jgi:hypothetical protein
VTQTTSIPHQLPILEHAVASAAPAASYKISVARIDRASSGLGVKTCNGLVYINHPEMHGEHTIIGWWPLREAMK